MVNFLNKITPIFDDNSKNKNRSRVNYIEKMSTVKKMYQIDNFEADALSWYD